MKPLMHGHKTSRRAVEINLSESGDFWVEVVSESPMGAFSWNAGQGRWMP